MRESHAECVRVDKYVNTNSALAHWKRDNITNIFCKKKMATFQDLSYDIPV